MASCLCWLASLTLLADAGDAEFWRVGRARELFISGLPSDEAALAAWAAEGVNSVTGVAPAVAHRVGLRTRSWFTMNYMDSRSMDEATIRSMSAVREDGGYLRPNDPLFPTVGQYGWSACVNNPEWLRRARAVLRKQAEDGYDGCHVDYASHYEPCFCEHCRARWQAWAAEHGLDLDLSAAAHSEELRVRMLLREFRIRCVMDFLAQIRAAARDVNPSFALDGTWHQDSGSTYQWAYGEHFDLMCIEGTTLGPFPPEGTQIPFLKLSQTLSRRADRRPPAASVTYHLLTDPDGRRFHGRMAADRVRVALSEIVSQGSVSWLGLGGPNTGNLLKEHQEIVRAWYRLARDLEPLLVDAEPVAEVGLVFSPRSYLLSGLAHTQLYALCQALMRGHIPFRFLSDVDLSLEDLAPLPVVVLLNAPALSDEACAALAAYVGGGGRLLLADDDAARFDSEWRERAERPAFATVPEGGQSLGAGQVVRLPRESFTAEQRGASQYVVLDQDRPTKLAIEGWSKAEQVGGAADSGYSLYVDLQHQDGTPLWGQVAVFPTGTHDWEFRRTIIESDRPFKGANVHLLFRGHAGTVWFRDVRFGVWDEAAGQIVGNLLVDRYRLPDGKFEGAADPARPESCWNPYGNGYELENMLDLGLWVKLASSRGLRAGPMHIEDPGATAALAALEPLLTVEGPGADSVYADLTRSGDRIALHLINYRAELHPELSEAEQQESDRSLPAGPLTIRLAARAGRFDPATLQARWPEEPGEVVATDDDGGGLTLRLARLTSYVVLTLTPL